MAATFVHREGDLLCPQCSGIYCLPVLLKCGHNICKICLQKFWKWKGSRECPVCRTVSVPERPPINLPLKIAAEEYQLQQSSKDQEVCFFHKEQLTLFCLNDDKPICSGCQMSTQHKVHECCTLEKAAQQKKTEFSTMLESFRKKLKMLEKTEVCWRETKEYIKTQADQNEKMIKEEFQTLHEFLQNEEMTRLQTLRQEEKVKTQVMCEKLELITNQIKCLASTISEVETALKAKDLSFLQEYKMMKKRVKCDFQEPECIRDILINSSKHLGLLKFGVWKKMSQIVYFVPITLDPNTAHFNLEFSQELSCVKYSRKQLLPNNIERCTSRLCVLGSSGFTSGKNSWTVEVGQSRDWYIGVARESIKRKKTVFLNPSEGFWVIGLTNGDTMWAQTSPPTKLCLKLMPEKITVELDCGKGKVVFVNAADRTTIYTFKDKFTERIFPYISPGISQEGTISNTLTIQPMNMTMNLV